VAGVRVDGVAVVAFFDAGPGEPVAADRVQAPVEARIAVDEVAVVALLPRAQNQPVSAEVKAFTAEAAPIARVVVPPVVAKLDSRPPGTIAAAGVHTVVAARVRVVGVAVIALFSGSNNAIATLVRRAGIRAFVIVDRVAVVAGLAPARRDNTITARANNAVVRAGIAIHGVSVVALLTGIEDAVSALLEPTDRRATVTAD